MKILYVYHSCFIIELKNSILVFDYFKMPDNKEDKIEELRNNFLRKEDKDILVFSTHSHYDHFNPEILEWKNENSKIKYILSDDIITDEHETISFVKEGDKLSLDKLEITVFGSTDLGVSFLVETEGKTIFHSGDLHLWHWEGDSPKEEISMKTAYEKIIADIKNSKKSIDIAFVPVDSRLGEYTYDGVTYFVKELAPKYLAPIHFWDDFKSLVKIQEVLSFSSTKLLIPIDYLIEYKINQ